MKIVFGYILLLASMIGCKSSKDTSSSIPIVEDYKSIASKKLGEDVDYFMNDGNTFVLCTHDLRGSTQQPRNSLYYIVIKLSDNSIVLEDRVSGGTVNWYNQKMIQVYLTPGNMRKDQTRDDFITLYNVETGKSYPKNLKETH